MEKQLVDTNWNKVEIYNLIMIQFKKFNFFKIFKSKYRAFYSLQENIYFEKTLFSEGYY